MTETTAARPRRAVRALITMVAVALLAPSFATTATAQEEPPPNVDLYFTTRTYGSALPGVPKRFDLEFYNDRFDPDSISNAVFETHVPAGVTVVALDDHCEVLPDLPASILRCSFATISYDPGIDPWERYRLAEVTFPTVGSYELVTTATADDTVPEAPDVRTIAVVEENADLVAGSELEGSGARQTVRHTFRNDGPTQAGFATVEGTLPPGVTLVPGTLRFRDMVDYMDEGCSVSATDYSCGPFHEDRFDYRSDYEYPFYIDPGWDLPYSRWVEYDVIVPAGTGPGEATATVVGRADPDLTDNTSVVTLEPLATPAPIGIELTGSAYTAADDGGPVTIVAEVTCIEPVSVTTQFTVQRPDPSGDVHTGTSMVTAPCTPGVPNPITSDHIDGFAPGAATVTAIASSGADHAGDDRTVTIEPFSTARDRLLARLTDPTDTTAVTDLIAALWFRLLYNPIWAQPFYAAILNG